VQGKRVGMQALWERAERLDRERELMAAAAVAQERMRIAQELHDVIGHNVSLIVVQAQALGSTTADGAVGEATDAIADLGRATMVEMQRTLRLLRDDGGEATPWAPQPGLDALDVLVRGSRAAGLDVDVAVRGTPRPLDQSIDTSAFRIIQESLTNVIRHAGGARARVTLAYGADVLDLSIVDDGGDDAGERPVAGSAGGHGLIGMRERATLFGGTFTAGLRAGRGFEVRVSLPYQEHAA
jgi:signal transduction histidine kinase